MNPRITALVSDTVIDGHFELASGLHSGGYLAKFRLLQHPDLLTEIARPLADNARQYQPGVVIGPTMGGSTVAYEMARLMRIRWGYAAQMPDRRKKGRYIPARYGDPALVEGERVLVADDVLTTGQTIQDTIDAITDVGGEPVAIAVIADRSNQQNHYFGIPVIRAVTLDIPSFKPAECLLCAKEVPIKRREA